MTRVGLVVMRGMRYGRDRCSVVTSGVMNVMAATFCKGPGIFNDHTEFPLKSVNSMSCAVTE